MIFSGAFFDCGVESGVTRGDGTGDCVLSDVAVEFEEARGVGLYEWVGRAVPVMDGVGFDEELAVGVGCPEPDGVGFDEELDVGVGYRYCFGLHTMPAPAGQVTLQTFPVIMLNVASSPEVQKYKTYRSAAGGQLS